MTAKITILVNNKGTATVRKADLQRIGANPGNFVDIYDLALKRKGFNRRAFLRLVFHGGAAIGYLANFIQVGTFFRDEHRQAVETDQELLKRLLGETRALRIAVVPARNHPFHQLLENEDVYPIEAECCRAYLDRFTDAYIEHSANGIPHIKPGDGAVVFGSQVSNLITRGILGNPFRDDVVERVYYTHRHHVVGNVGLRWNLRMDRNSPTRVRQQYGLDWQYHDHVLHDFRTGSDLSLDNPNCEDFLLVTALPRGPDSNTRFIIIFGLHGVGTLAASDIFRRPPIADLRRLEKEIGRKPFYQALFKISAAANTVSGELVPKSLSLQDMEPLSWTGGRG
jgi:hypothetical protein